MERQTHPLGTYTHPMTTPTHTLTTHHTDITTLHPHPNNPRNGNTDAIADSLTTNGQYKPIVTTKDGTILAGNHTYAAAMELGWSHIDAVVLDLDPDSEQAQRIMLADNRTSDLARYDDGLLLQLLDTLPDPTVGTGFDTWALEALARKADANLVFTTDTSDAADEFLNIAADGVGGTVEFKYFDKVTVFFRDQEARDEFFAKLDTDLTPGTPRFRWPEDWKYDKAVPDFTTPDD